ncbi:MAG: aldolase [Polaromonas sp. 39-63-203]|uniref:class II aldolase/adducin family protein n=1 Tax=Polaromonas sp. TaxID=1869339 RepID=UPI000BC7464D|nr:aldolase [Polaromonas sp.]OYY52505.1 MAG: aldolase [Polaromonas sp. 35-63-240]OYY99455.1 MAG: aldolase [Polaromonas sp. 28-63-22]OYZ83833.1 MAG: aldolase [Polaromonas sp. 24-62-144]OZA98398.1 MAG: aldolase [Polaromonas sp. 39-63-203]HQS32418.1 aldolase [Polaromonas sp.]
MTETHARDEICRVGRSLFERGYVHASAGNISVRLDDGFLITPTDACLGFLDPAQLARVDAHGRQTSGERASKTLALHTRIYAAAMAFDPGTRCIIHTHSTHSVALSLGCHSAELLPPLTPYFVMKVGHVPLLPYTRPGDPAVGAQVAALIEHYGHDGKPLRAVMLQRLGPNVWHDSPAAAMATLEELEETARLALLTRGDAPAPLTESQIDELRRVFGARW